MIEKVTVSTGIGREEKTFEGEDIDSLLVPLDSYLAEKKR